MTLEQSHPFYEGWFSPSGRRERLSFVLANVSASAVYIGIFFAISLFPIARSTENLLQILFGLLFVAAGYMLTIHRLRDIGLSGWFSLLWLLIGMLSAEYHVAFTLAFWFVLALVPSRVPSISNQEV